MGGWDGWIILEISMTGKGSEEAGVEHAQTFQIYR